MEAIASRSFFGPEFRRRSADAASLFEASGPPVFLTQDFPNYG